MAVCSVTETLIGRERNMILKIKTVIDMACATYDRGRTYVLIINGLCFGINYYAVWEGRFVQERQIIHDYVLDERDNR